VRLPSLQAAAADAQRTLARFPAVLGSALVAAVTACVLVAREGDHPQLNGVLAAAGLGLALFTALTVTAERIGARAAKTLLLLAGALTLVLFAVAWPHWTQSVQGRRLAQFAVGFHLFVAFLPYLRRNELNGFWQFNRALFLRFLTAMLYSQVLYAGLSIALVAIDKLLKIHVPPKSYLYLWILIGFIFNTWFFLGGVPADLDALEQRRDYPRGLKVFAQFILIPLVVIYLVILTAYLGRILVTGQWPSGWIGWLVSSVAAIGILSLLLVHPIRNLDENRWVGTYARWFYVAMLPAIAVLLAAIGKRVFQYGITEDRYFIAVLSLWLTAVAITFISRRNADIRWIPITLSLLAFTTAFGPWGAYTVSRQSQLGHLRRLLAQEGLIANGVAQRATHAIPFEVRRDISSTLAYLVGTHGRPAVTRLLGPAAAAADTTGVNRRYHDGQADATAMLAKLDIDFVHPWDGRQSTQFWFTASGEQAMVDLTGLKWHARLTGMLPNTFRAGDEHWELAVDRHAHAVVLRNTALEHDTPTQQLRFPLDSLIEQSRLGRTGPALAPRLEADSPATHAMLVVRSLNGNLSADTLQYLQMDGDLYLSLRRSPE